MAERSRKVPVTGVAFAIALSISFPAAAENFQTLNYHSVANGPTVVLKSWTCWFGPDRGCRYAPCHMTTAQQPKLGTLRPLVSPGVIPTSGGACAGKPIPEMNMLYTPKPGAHGADEILLRTQSDNGWRHDIYIHVEVP